VTSDDRAHLDLVKRRGLDAAAPSTILSVGRARQRTLLKAHNSIPLPKTCRLRRFGSLINGDRAAICTGVAANKSGSPIRAGTPRS
jgi:hypothetical protein